MFPTRRPRLLAILVVLLVAVSGCSSDDGAADTAVTAEQVLIDAAAAMSEVETAAFTLEQTGAPVPIDEEGQLLFQAADGRIARPSSAQALVTVEALGFTTEVGAIAIDGTAWFTNPLTGDWTEAPPSFTFDPAILLDPENGFAGLLTEVATTATLVEPTDAASADDPDGDGSWHRIETIVSAERVEVLTSGLIGAETTVNAWIDTDSNRLAQLRFELPIGNEISNWLMVITEYDIDVDISPPVDQ